MLVGDSCATSTIEAEAIQTESEPRRENQLSIKRRKGLRTKIKVAPGNPADFPITGSDDKSFGRRVGSATEFGEHLPRPAADRRKCTLTD